MVAEKIKTSTYNNLRAVARLLRRIARRRLSTTEAKMIEHAIEHWRNRLQALLQTKPQPNAAGYVIFHSARVGSTALTDQLSQHPKIFANGEILLPLRTLHYSKHWTRWLCPKKGYLAAMIEYLHRRWRKTYSYPPPPPPPPLLLPMVLNSKTETVSSWD